jgi:hypothetical protein
MMDTLGIEVGRERAAYFSDEEYAASLLGTTLEELGGFDEPGQSIR